MIDTSNQFGVGVRGDNVVITLMYGNMEVTKPGALNLSIWLFALSGTPIEDFPRELDALSESYNQFGVGVRGELVVISLMYGNKWARPTLTRAEALNLSMWLFALSGASIEEFTRGLEAISEGPK